jgi:two-component system NtrC family sensor kinase
MTEERVPPAPGQAGREAGPTLADALTSEAALGWPEPAADAPDAALLDRPRITIRTRITLAFAIIFALCVVITVWSMIALSNVEDRLHFLEVADGYTSEIQEARRYEKNFLLYGSDLEAALHHLDRAEALLDENLPRVRKVVGAPALATMTGLAESYRAELLQLQQVRDEARKAGVEADVRRSGGQMVAMAQDFRAKESSAIHDTLALARRIPVLFLAVVLVLMLLTTAFLVAQIHGALRRFTDYTERIGAGDYTPIVPTRRYRDEFSHLAVALNRMIRELDHRQRILVESHKLRAIGALVAGVAHELNNPLNNIMLTAAMLEEEPGCQANAEVTGMVRDILTETERSKRIVRNLLDFARQKETTIEPLDLGGTVDKAVQLVANQARMAKGRLVVDVPPDLPPVHGDRQMLCQVFVNLILNAVDAIPEGGRVHISVHPEHGGEQLAVEVTDDGPGIPPEVLPHIFEPFFTTKARGKGTGLGLSVSQGIVRALGGHLRVRSRPGEGSTFTVVLPTTRVPAVGTATKRG